MNSKKRDELILRKTDVEETLSRITHQIHVAKLKGKLEGKQWDPVWMSKATKALKHNDIMHKKILVDLSKMPQAEKPQSTKTFAEKPQSTKTFAHNFVQIARGRLDPELFQEILHDATELLSQEEEIA
jgi:hypothetical protein